MKKFLLGAVAALGLLSAPAFADNTVIGPDTLNGSEFQIWCYNTTNSVYDVCFRAVNGPTPFVSVSGANFKVDGVPLATTLATIGTPFSGVYSDLTGKPSLFSGVYSDLSSKPTLFDGAYSSLTGKPTLFDGTYASLTGKPSTFTPSTHTHAESDVTGLVTDLAGKASTSTVIGTGATLGNAATNANTSQITNYNLLSGVLGLADGLNAANSSQNDLAAKYNDLATKYNTLLAMLKARNVPSN